MSRLLLFIPLCLFAGLGIIFALSIGESPQNAANAMVGKRIPDFTLPGFNLKQSDPKSQDYTLAQVRGIVSVGEPWLINVFASWCAQCYLEHGFITRLSEQVMVVGLNYKDPPENAGKFLTELGNPYNLVLADLPGDYAFDLGVSGAPETFLISPDGQILARHAGVIDRLVWDQKFAELWRQYSEPIFKE